VKRLLGAVALVIFATAPALADPKSDVMAAFLQFGKASSYHVSVNTKQGSIEADMAPPAKLHMISPQFEMIKIDTTTWLKIGGQWRQMSIPGLDTMTGVVTDKIAMLKGNAQPDDYTVVDLGMKVPLSGGAPLHAYTVTNKAGTSPATIFIDGGRVVEVDDARDATSMTFSKFNVPVDIKPPM
jgi:hypothetical protein